ncbi:MAG: hypothetical protein ACKO2P_14675 [Planctomycetota bacterium]
MPILQLHYTSCRSGLSGHSGFQTRSISPGLNPEAVQQIEPLCQYVPPRGAAANPTAEEIDRSFPVSFRRATLRDGRWLLLRTQLAGTNYDGRPGNLFSHALIGSAAPAPDFDPLRICFWPHWKKRLSPEEDLPTAPPPLPVIPETEVSAQPGLPISRLREFLNSAPERIPLASQMLRSILLIHSERRSLLIVDQPDRALFWLSVLLTALPLPLAQTLSFNTWQTGFEALADLNMTGPGSEIAEDLCAGATDPRYQLFDFPNRRFCNPAGASGDFAETAISLIATGQDQELRELHALMACFGETGFSDALNQLAGLFALRNAQRPLPIGWALPEFLIQRLEPRHLLKCAEILKTMLNSQDWSQRPELLDALVRLVQVAHAENQHEDFSQTVFEVTGILWRRQFLTSPDAREPIARCVTQLQRLIPAKLHQHPEGLLSEQELAAFLEQLFQKAPQHLNAALADLSHRTLVAAPADFTIAPWPTVRESLARIHRSHSSGSAVIPLEWCGGHYPTLAAWIVAWTENDHPEADQLAEHLATRIHSSPGIPEPAVVSALLRRLDELAASRFLQAAWNCRVEHQLRAWLPVLAESITGFAQDVPRFWGGHRRELMTALLARLDDAGREKLMIDLFRAGLEDMLPVSDSAELLRVASAAVSLDRLDQPSADIVQRLTLRGLAVQHTDSARMQVRLLMERLERTDPATSAEYQKVADLLPQVSDDDFTAATMSLLELSFLGSQSADSGAALYRLLSTSQNRSALVETGLQRLFGEGSARNWTAECWVSAAGLLLQPELRERSALRRSLVESLRKLPRAFWRQCRRHAEVRWSGPQNREQLRDWRNLFAKPSSPWWRRWWW